MPNKTRLRCYFGCRKDGPLHLFPNPNTGSWEVLERFNIWKSILPASLQEKGNNYIYNTLRLCNRHFLESYCLPSHRLTKNAVPTLYIEPQVQSSEELVLQQTTNPKCDQPSKSAATNPSGYASGGQAPEVTTLQQTNGKDQAVAKRALNETLSPHREYKRPRLAKKNYAQAACTSLNVAVTCDRTGVLSQEVSAQVVAAIQRQIISEAGSRMQDKPGPTFNSQPQFGGGVLKLWCANNHSLTWLKKTISGLAGTSLVVKSQSEIQKRVCCGIIIPDDQKVYEDSTFIRRTLCYQNPWVDAKRWILLHSEKQKACWFVVLSIPEDQIPTLMNAGRRLAIGLGSVYVKFEDPNGRFVEVPRGWDPDTKQFVDTGVIVSPPNDPGASAADPPVAAEHT